MFSDLPAIAWSDLPLVQRVAESALRHAVALSAVTPDGVAASLTSACGIETAAIPIGSASAETTSSPAVPRIATG